MPTPISTFGTFAGIGKETTYGTAVVATAFPPCTSVASEDVKNYVADTGMRGSRVAAYNQLATQGWGTFQYDGAVYLDTIGYALKGLLGDETLTGSGPYIHAISTLNSGTYQPQSYTLVDYNGYVALAYPGSVFSSLALTMDATNLLTYTAQATGLPSSTVTKPTQVFTSKTATAGYKGAITIGGSATSLVENAQLTITQAVNPVIAVNGTSAPTNIQAGAVDVSGSFTVIYEDDTFRTPMLSGASTIVGITYTNGADSLLLTASNVLFTKAPVTRGGNGWMEITVDFAGTADTTDAGASGGYSPIKATLTNTVSTVY